MSEKAGLLVGPAFFIASFKTIPFPKAPHALRPCQAPTDVDALLPGGEERRSLYFSRSQTRDRAFGDLGCTFPFTISGIMRRTLSPMNS